MIDVIKEDRIRVSNTSEGFGYLIDCKLKDIECHTAGFLDDVPD
jgi:hypothetical protein